MAHVAGALVNHEAAALHPDGVAAAEVGVQVRAVVAALIAPALEVPVLVKNDLLFFFVGKIKRVNPVKHMIE